MYVKCDRVMNLFPTELIEGAVPPVAETRANGIELNLGLGWPFALRRFKAGWLALVCCYRISFYRTPLPQRWPQAGRGIL